ncbi:MAG: hypothetical protein AAFY53_11365 [Pseudomonadota bacterium]
MQAWVQSGALFDAILALIAAEAIVLVLFARRRSWSRPVLRVAAMLAPGALLFFGIKLAVTGADWRPIIAVISGAGLLHAIDLVFRFRRS